MFADTDFLFALIKDRDWLKDKAEKIFKEHEGEIRTSISVIMELGHLCKRFNMNVMEVFAHVFELIEVTEETYSICTQAAVYIEKYNLTVFDAFNAAYCGHDKIISSDSVYDTIGLERIRLEK
ncbi:PIN domain-containing protein [Candidatus Woesearchaeota archaeon]|nr:PIN domain-containing protein [Candidatus Woesearchaeota archaeon]